MTLSGAWGCPCPVASFPVVGWLLKDHRSGERQRVCYLYSPTATMASTGRAESTHSIRVGGVAGAALVLPGVSEDEGGAGGTWEPVLVFGMLVSHATGHGAIVVAPGSLVGPTSGLLSLQLVLDSQKRVFSWGFGGYGRLGHAEQKDEMVPRLVKLFDFPGRGASQIYAGYTCSFAVSEVGGCSLPACPWAGAGGGTGGVSGAMLESFFPP